MRYMIAVICGFIVSAAASGLAQQPGYRLVNEDGSPAELKAEAQATASASVDGDTCVLNTWLPATVTKSQQLVRDVASANTKVLRDQRLKKAQEQLWKTLTPLAGKRVRYSLTVANVIKRDDGSYLIVGTIAFDNPPMLTDAQKSQLDFIDLSHKTTYDNYLRLSQQNIATTFRRNYREQADAIKERWDAAIENVMGPIREAIPAQTLYVSIGKKSGIERLAPGQIYKAKGWIHQAAMFICTGKDATAVSKTPDSNISGSLETSYIAIELTINQ